MPGEAGYCENQYIKQCHHGMDRYDTVIVTRIKLVCSTVLYCFYAWFIVSKCARAIKSTSNDRNTLVGIL